MFDVKNGRSRARRAWLGYAALEHVSFNIDNIPEVFSIVRIGV